MVVVSVIGMFAAVYLQQASAASEKPANHDKMVNCANQKHSNAFTDCTKKGDAPFILPFP
jgi:hypothetical protein